MKPSLDKLQQLKKDSESWAQERLSDDNTLIIDVETTGILKQDPDTEIVQLSAINNQGRSVVSLLIKPAVPLKPELTAIHGISNKMLESSPTFPQIAELLAFILGGKHVVAFNADFDISLIVHLYKKYNIPVPKFSGASCCMDRYSEWKGEWNESKGSIRWQKLPNLSGLPSHDSLSDCISTLRVMELMANGLDMSELKAEEISLDF